MYVTYGKMSAMCQAHRKGGVKYEWGTESVERNQKKNRKKEREKGKRKRKKKKKRKVSELLLQISNIPTVGTCQTKK